MLCVLFPALVSCLTPVPANDDLLKHIFNGPGPSVVMIEHGNSNRRQPTSIFQPADLDPDKFLYSGPDEITFDNPEYLEWYLEGITGAVRPRGMTDREFAEYTDRGCDGARICGTVDP